MRAKLARATGAARQKTIRTDSAKRSSKRTCGNVVEPLESRELLTTYYVSPSGRDNAAGTSQNSAWKTITRVNQQNLRSGDKVLFKGNATFNGTLYLTGNESGVTISSYGGRASIHGGNWRGIDVLDGNGTTITNINVRGNGMYANGGSGIYFHTNTAGKVMDSITVSDVAVSGFGAYDIKFEAWTGGSRYQNVRITNASIHDSLEGGIWINGSANRVHKNIYIANVYTWNHPGNGSWNKVTGNGIALFDVDGATIENSVAHDNGANGKAPVGIWTAGSNRVTIQNCESFNNKTIANSDGGGFDFDWDVTNSVMQYNYSHDNEGPGFLVCGDNHNSDGNVIRYNISQNDGRKNGVGAILLYGNAKNLKIHNNTVYMNPTGRGDSAAFKAFHSGGTSMSNVDVRNNIFYTVGGVSVVDVDNAITDNGSNSFLGNAYHAGGSGFNIRWSGRNFNSLDSFRGGTGKEKMNGANVGYQGDPGLKAAGRAGKVDNARNMRSSLWHYQLNGNSPMINRGVSLAGALAAAPTDFYGNSTARGGKYDIGASEA